MPEIKAHLHGWHGVLLAALGAVLSTTALYAWNRQHFPAAALLPAPEQGWPALTAGSPALRGHAATAAEEARARLEAAGVAVDGAAYVQAINAQHRPLLQLLEQAGVPVDARAPGGRTALLAAACNQDWAMVNQLLERGANPNLADEAGTTPLMAAAAAARLSTLLALLSHGARPELADEHGRTAAHYALAAHSPEALGLVLPGVTVAGEKPQETDLLTWALETGDWRYIGPVLQQAPTKLAWSPGAHTALEEALRTRDADRTRALLSHHAAAPTPAGGQTPLLAYAVAEGDLERLKLLLAAGADPNTRLGMPVDKEFARRLPSERMRSYVSEEPGMTALMLAAGLARPDFVQPLLDAGAKRGLTTEKWKMAALSFAAFTESPATLQMLIDDSPKPEQVRVEISLGLQRATLYRNGASVFSTEISSGRSGFSTPKGDFVITDKHANHKSTIYKVPMPFFMRLNCRDFGMHEGAIPGYPASHGCIRLPGSSARQLFKEIPVGTLVSIRD